MRLHLVNPNTSTAMTQSIAVAARAAVRQGTEIVATQSEFGPASIEGYYDGALAVPGLLARIAEAERAEVGAHVIACFDDTGLDAARALASAPVLGIGEAAFHAASMIGVRFSVVTTLSRSIAPIRDNLTRYGLIQRCASVRAAEIPVLDLAEHDGDARERIAAEIMCALRDDGADTIVLGCAGMADLARDFSTRFQAPVIDGVATAVAFAEALATLGLKTAKGGGYASPIAKPFTGMFARFAPSSQG